MNGSRSDAPGVPDVAIRDARPTELPQVMNVLDGALLATETARVRERIAADGVSLAVAGERVLGVLVTAPGQRRSDRTAVSTANGNERPTGPHRSTGVRIEAIVVRRARRGQGIGRALIAAADARTASPLIATFDAAVRPFYESVGFEIRPIDDDRWYGRLPRSNDARYDR